MAAQTAMELDLAPGSARLMLLDTYGLVYRAFFALPELTTTRGMRIEAAYGFTMMLNKLIADEKPTHVIAAFDKGLPAARVALYPQYKAQRNETPDELREQFTLVRRILATFAIPVVEIDGEEADDIIATLARRAEELRQESLVVTGDLDLLQIVDPRTTVLTTRRGITELGRYDEAKVRERYDLEPRQLPDYRGLKGDPSDNLPGIPGVGEKTAIKLVKTAGSLDALLANPKLAGTPKLEALIREHGEVARVCRDVSLIKRDLAVAIDWEAARYATPPNDELYELYRDLEFKTLLAKLEPPATPHAVASEEQLQGEYASYTSITDPPDYAKLAALIEDAAGRERVAVAQRGEVYTGSPACCPRTVPPRPPTPRAGSRSRRAKSWSAATRSRCTPTSSSRWSRCWRRWNAPASRSTSARCAICRRRSTKRWSDCSARSTGSRAKSSTSARRSSSAESCSTSSACRRAARTRPATRPAPTCCKGSRRASPSRRRSSSGARSRRSRAPTSTCCRRWSMRTAASTRCSTRPRPRPAGCRRPTQTCRTSPCAPSSGGRCARRSSRRRTSACCSRRTTRRSSCG